MTTQERLDELLGKAFSPGAKHTKAAGKHFARMGRHFQVNEQEECLGRAGKFVEAILKALYVHTGHTLPLSREFKVGKVINELGRIEKERFDSSIRIVIPRACQFVYDISSNRGGRHDPGEIDPNEMDSRTAVAMSSWIMAEMVRLSQKGCNPEEAKSLVDSLVEKKYPLFEDVDGRLYFHGKISAARTALVLLWRRYPKRVGKVELRGWLKRRFTASNVSNALKYINAVVDDDGNGNFLLLGPGLREAEAIISNSRSGTS